jgi:hypothetical protein
MILFLLHPPPTYYSLRGTTLVTNKWHNCIPNIRSLFHVIYHFYIYHLLQPSDAQVVGIDKLIPNKSKHRAMLAIVGIWGIWNHIPSQRENFCSTIFAFGVEGCYVPSRIVAVIHLESDREPQHFMSLLVKYMRVGMKQHQWMTTQCIKWAAWNYYALVCNHVVSGHHADLRPVSMGVSWVFHAH